MQQLSLVPGNIQIKTRVDVFAWIVLRVTHLIVGREWGGTRGAAPMLTEIKQIRKDHPLHLHLQPGNNKAQRSIDAGTKLQI